MKYGVSSYSFSQMFRDNQITQIGLIKKAKELGFDGIEFVDMPHFGEITLEDAHLYKEEAQKYGIDIVCFTLAADFLCPSGGSLDAEAEKLCKKIDIAASLGAKLIRHDATGGSNPDYRTFDDALPVLAEGCKKVTEYAEKLGIRTMVENHGHFCQDALRVEKLVNAVNHKNFGLLVDMGNFLCADNDPALSVSICSRYAFHIHAKDFIVKSGNEVNPGAGFFMSRGGNFLRGTILGQGNVPVMSCLRAISKAGYEDYICIEFEGCEPCEYAIKTGLDNLKRYIAAL